MCIRDSRHLELVGGHEERAGAGVELSARGGVVAGVVRKRQVVRPIGGGAGKSEALRRAGDGLGQARGVASIAGGEGLGEPLRLEDRPGEARRVAAVDLKWREAAHPQVRLQPVCAPFLGDLGPLLDAPAVEDLSLIHISEPTRPY